MPMKMLTFGIVMALASLTLASAMAEARRTAAQVCHLFSAKCVAGCGRTHPSGSAAIYQCFKTCDRVVDKCLDEAAVPAKEAPLDPGPRQPPKQTLPGGAPLPDILER